MRIDSTYSDVKTMLQVPLCQRISDLEMNWTSSFLFQSDKHVVVLHLLVAPVHTEEKPAEHEIVRRQSLLLVA